MNRYKRERLDAVVAAWQRVRDGKIEDQKDIERLVEENRKRRERAFHDALSAALVDANIPKLWIQKAGGPSRPTLDKWLKKLGLEDDIPKIERYENEAKKEDDEW